MQWEKPFFEYSAKSIDITSVNRKAGGVHPKYKSMLSHLTELFKLCVEGEPYAEFSAMRLFIKTAKDIDNCDKIIQDALQKAGVIKDDKDILYKQVIKVPADSNKEKETIILSMHPMVMGYINGSRLLLDRVKEVKLWEAVDP